MLKDKSALSALLLVVSPYCKAQVYSIGVYSGGTFYHTISSTTFAFPPYSYKLTTISWREDARGFTIMDVNYKGAPGDVVRQSLKVECGSEKFTVPMDFVPPNLARSRRLRSGDGEWNGLPVAESSGDLARLVRRYATKRGGRLTANGLPLVQAKWVHQSRPLQDIVIVDRDCFAEAQKFLEQSCGKPDPSLSATNVNGQSLTYTPDQIGVLLNLTGTRTRTIVSIIEKQKP